MRSRMSLNNEWWILEEHEKITDRVLSKIKQYQALGREFTVRWDKPAKPRTDRYVYGGATVELMPGASRPIALHIGTDTIMLDGSEIMHILDFEDEGQEPHVVLDYSKVGRAS